MKLNAIKVDQLNIRLEEESTVLLDIREEYEYEDYHLESIHIPMAEVRSNLEQLDPYQNVIICCKSGNRAKAVAHMLNGLLEGKDISYLEGGLEAYKIAYA